MVFGVTAGTPSPSTYASRAMLVQALLFSSVYWSEGACKARTRDVNFPRGPGGRTGALCPLCVSLSTFTPVFQVKIQFFEPGFSLLSATRTLSRAYLHQRELGFVVLPMTSPKKQK